MLPYEWCTGCLLYFSNRWDYPFLQTGHDLTCVAYICRTGLSLGYICQTLSSITLFCKVAFNVLSATDGPPAWHSVTQYDLGGCLSRPVSTHDVSFQALSCLYGTLNFLQYHIHNQWFVSNVQCHDERLSNYRIRSQTHLGFFFFKSIRNSQLKTFSSFTEISPIPQVSQCGDCTRNSRNQCTHWSIFLLVFLLVLDSIYSNKWMSIGPARSQTWPTVPATGGVMAWPAVDSAECNSGGSAESLSLHHQQHFHSSWEALLSAFPFPCWRSLQKLHHLNKIIQFFKLHDKNDMTAHRRHTQTCHFMLFDRMRPVQSQIIHRENLNMTLNHHATQSLSFTRSVFPIQRIIKWNLKGTFSGSHLGER